MRIWRAKILCSVLGTALIASSAMVAIDLVSAPQTAGAAPSTVVAKSGGPGGSGAISCSGPTTCTAVSEGDVYTMQDGVWGSGTEIDNMEFAGFGWGTSSAISCSDANDCTAVGTSYTGNFPAIVTETDGTWGSVQTFPAPSGYEGGLGWFSSVSCSDALDCTAVGAAPLETPDDDGYTDQPIAITETDGAWGATEAIPAPTVDAAESGQEASGVSCTSAGNCVAVGQGYGYSPFEDGSTFPLVATESGDTWSTYQMNDTPITALTGVSCPDTSDCTAVGDTDGGNAATFSVAGGSPSAPTVIGSGFLEGVDCVSAGNCVAVNNSTGTDLYMVETDGTWAPVTVTWDHGQTYTGAWLNSVSCADVNDCTAVGPDTYTITNTPMVTVTDNAPIAGHDLVLTATVAGTDAFAPTGAVDWNVFDPSSNAAACTTTTGPTASGNVSTYTCTISGPVAGTWRATAAFEGDAQYATETSLEDDAVVAPIGGSLTLTKNTKLHGGVVMKIAGSGWNVNGDTSVTLYQCATDSYISAVCDQATKVTTSLGTGAKAGTFKKAKLRLTAGSMDSREDTCGLVSSGLCFVVAVGSAGDEVASSSLAFTPPTATLKSTSAVVANTVDKVTATSFPAGDTVTAEECDSSVTVATLSSHCDGGTTIVGVANAKGKVAFSPPGVTIVDGSSYTESGSGTVVPGGGAHIVVNDNTTSGAFAVIPITLHA